MNRLPEHRRLLAGRTHCTAWNPADSDPVTFYPQGRISNIAGFLMAVVIGVLLALLLVHWMAS